MPTVTANVSAKAITEAMISSLSAWFCRVRENVARGCNSRCMVSRNITKAILNLKILIPPLVEPEQPPTKVSRKNRTTAKLPQLV